MVVFAVDDAMVEAWFSRQAGPCSELSEALLADVAQWFPVIGVIANDNALGPQVMQTIPTYS